MMNSADDFLTELNNLVESDELFEVEEQVELPETTPEPDPLKDLDQLLAGAMKLAVAKKAKAQGRLLAEDQKELLAQVSKFREEQIWIEQTVIAHFVNSACNCGVESSQLSGYYSVFKHKTSSAMKLVRNDSHVETLAEPTYTTHTRQTSCGYCRQTVEVASCYNELLKGLK